MNKIVEIRKMMNLKIKSK